MRTFFSKKVLTLSKKLSEKVFSLNIILLNGIFCSKETTRRTLAYRRVVISIKQNNI